MRLVKKIFLVNLFVLSAIIFDGSFEVKADVIHTETRYTVKDELFTSYTSYDLKDLARKIKDRMISLKENAWKKFNNLLPMQGSSRAITAKAKEQAMKVKDQQRVRNRIQPNPNDLRQKNRNLAMLRADLKSKMRLNR